MQTEIVNLALDLLVREPDVEGFFGALTKMMVEESESQTCGVWLIDDSGERCHLWMVFVKDRLYTPDKDDWDAQHANDEVKRPAARAWRRTCSRIDRGWAETVEYACDDERLPEPFRAFARRMDKARLVATPMILGGRTLGWMTLSTRRRRRRARASGGGRPARGDRAAGDARAASQPAGRRNRRRRAAQGDSRRAQPARARHPRQPGPGIRRHPDAAAGGAARERRPVRRRWPRRSRPPSISPARTSTEARRSVGALRPNVGQGEDVAAALEADGRPGRSARPTTPIDVDVDELPRARRRRRAGDHRHRAGGADQRRPPLARAPHHDPRLGRCGRSASACRWPTTAAGSRAIAATAGFGMTSMQERAERIGASLTIVTAPRSRYRSRAGLGAVVAADPQVPCCRLSAVAVAVGPARACCSSTITRCCGPASPTSSTRSPTSQVVAEAGQRRRGDRRVRAASSRRDAAGSADAGDGRASRRSGGSASAIRRRGSSC